MSDITLDTSGHVHAPTGKPDGSWAVWFWSDLDPFTQGYAEAMFASLRDSPLPSLNRARFSDLDPETLSALRSDCAAYRSRYEGMTPLKVYGRQLWAARQGNCVEDLPPLTAHLTDIGKVMFRAKATGAE